MFKNRLVLILAALSMLLVTLAASQPFSKPSKSGDLSQPSRSLFVPYIMDSATRSYIAWGQAMQARNAMDSGTRSYTAWAKAAEAEASTMDSATRSYIAQAKAVACGVDATYGLDLDSATRSYIAWGLALQAKNDIGASCR